MAGTNSSEIPPQAIPPFLNIDTPIQLIHLCKKLILKCGTSAEWYQYQSWGKLQKGGFSLKETTWVPIRVDHEIKEITPKGTCRIVQATASSVLLSQPWQGATAIEIHRGQLSRHHLSLTSGEAMKKCQGLVGLKHVKTLNHSLDLDSLIHGWIEMTQQDHWRLRVTNGKHIGNPFVSRVLPITGAIGAIWAVETIQLF